MTKELKACPKCGKAGTAEIHRGNIDQWRYTGQVGRRRKITPAWGVTCEKCGAHVWGYSSRSSACEAWNAGEVIGGCLIKNSMLKYYTAK